MKLKNKLLLYFCVLFFVTINIYGVILMEYNFNIILQNTINNSLGEYSVIYANIKSNENAKNIFKHMVNIQNENAGQFSEKKLNKYHMRKQIKEDTGYDLDDLEIKNNSFYTKDGTDIYNMVCKVLAEQEMPRDVKSAMYVWYREQLKDLSKFYKRTPELILQIDFCNGSLYDVNQRQQYGTGQTEWIDEMLKYRSTNGYM